MIHCRQVHKEAVKEAPNSIPGRDRVDISIFGMAGVPQDAVEEYGVRTGKRPRVDPVAVAEQPTAAVAGERIITFGDRVCYSHLAL